MIGRIHTDSKPGALAIPRQHLDQRGKDRFEKGAVIGGVHILADGLDIPERGINGVVFGFFPCVGETIGQHALVGILREGRQDAASDVNAPGGQGESR